jgi:hypothetical protein
MDFMSAPSIELGIAPAHWLEPASQNRSVSMLELETPGASVGDQQRARDLVETREHAASSSQLSCDLGHVFLQAHFVPIA